MQGNINNIFLVGPMGSGKSTIGKKLAKELNYDFYDTDQEMEKNMGVDISWILDIEGEEGLRARELKLIDSLILNNNIILATGGNCVDHPEIRDKLNGNGFVIHLDISISEQCNRTDKDTKRPWLQDKPNLEQTLNKFSEKYSDFYKSISDLTIKTDNKPIREIINEILNTLESQ